MNFWRFIALPMAVLCFVLAVLFTFVWPIYLYAFGAVCGTGIYTFMYFDETKKYRNRIR